MPAIDPDSADLRRLCLALADHARSALADIGRLGDTLTKHLPPAALSDDVVVELQSIDRVGQSIEDSVRMLERLAERPRLHGRQDDYPFEDVVAVAHLRTTRLTMMQHLWPDQSGQVGEGGLTTRSTARSEAGRPGGSVDLF